MKGLMCLQELMLKTKLLHKGIICHYPNFLRINFRFHPKVCNDCHDLIQKGMSFNDPAIVSVKGNECQRIRLWYLSEDEFINLLKNADLA